MFHFAENLWQTVRVCHKTSSKTLARYGFYDTRWHNCFITENSDETSPHLFTEGQTVPSWVHTNENGDRVPLLDVLLRGFICILTFTGRRQGRWIVITPHEFTTPTHRNHSVLHSEQSTTHSIDVWEIKLCGFLYCTTDYSKMNYMHPKPQAIRQWGNNSNIISCRW